MFKQARCLLSLVLVLAAVSQAQQTAQAQQASVRYSLFCAKAGEPALLPLETITQGRVFDLVAFVKDLRPRINPQRGIFATYCDVKFNRQLSYPMAFPGRPFVDSVKFGAMFYNPPARTAQAFLVSSGINRIGSMSTSTVPVGQKPQELFRVRMYAANAGEVKFAVAFGSLELPMDRTLVFAELGEQYIIPASEIEVVPATLVITR